MIRSGPFAADGQTELAAADPLLVPENPIRFFVCEFHNVSVLLFPCHPTSLVSQ